MNYPKKVNNKGQIEFQMKWTSMSVTSGCRFGFQKVTNMDFTALGNVGNVEKQTKTTFLRVEFLKIRHFLHRNNVLAIRIFVEGFAIIKTTV